MFLTNDEKIRDEVTILAGTLYLLYTENKLAYMLAERNCVRYLKTGDQSCDYRLVKPNC